jgi:hypothetical protein
MSLCRYIRHIQKDANDCVRKPVGIFPREIHGFTKLYENHSYTGFMREPDLIERCRRQPVDIKFKA